MLLPNTSAHKLLQPWFLGLYHVICLNWFLYIAMGQIRYSWHRTETELLRCTTPTWDELGTYTHSMPIIPVMIKHTTIANHWSLSLVLSECPYDFMKKLISLKFQDHWWVARTTTSHLGGFAEPAASSPRHPQSRPGDRPGWSCLGGRLRQLRPAG